MDFTKQDKAVVAGLMSALAALAARFGWQPSGEAVSVASIILTALVPYVVTHVVVFFKANKTIPVVPVPPVLPQTPSTTPLS